MKFIIKPATEASVQKMRPAMSELLISSGLKIGKGDLDTYLVPGRDVVMSFDAEVLAGFCVISRTPVATAQFTGYLLAVVHPDYRGRGILGKMASRYLIRKLPGMLVMASVLRRPLYLFADISNPVSYRRLHVGQKIYPDLVRGDQAADLLAAKRIRTQLAAALHVPDLDIETGLVRGGGSVGERRSCEDGTAPWQRNWHRLVPKDCDLIAIVPVTLVELVKAMRAMLIVAVSGRYSFVQAARNARR